MWVGGQKYNTYEIMFNWVNQPTAKFFLKKHSKMIKITQKKQKQTEFNTFELSLGSIPIKLIGHFLVHFINVRHFGGKLLSVAGCSI